jgi:hypothetical protein
VATVFLSKMLALTGSLVVAALAAPSTTSPAPETFAASVLATTASARVGGAAHGVSQQRKPTLAGVVRLLVHDGAPGALVVLRTPTKVRRAASGSRAETR